MDGTVAQCGGNTERVGYRCEQVRLRKHGGDRLHDALTTAMATKPVVHDGDPSLFKRRNPWLRVFRSEKGLNLRRRGSDAVRKEKLAEPAGAMLCVSFAFPADASVLAIF